MVLVVQLAGTVAAHVELERSEPAAGSRLDTAPEAVRLVFSGVVQSKGARMAVTSPDGMRISDGEPEVVDEIVTQPLDSLPIEERYTVAYRVVSADGHPVSDTFAFTYVWPEEARPSPSPVNSAGDTTPNPGTTAMPAGASGNAGNPGSSLSWWPSAALAVLLAAAAVAVVRLRRQRS